MHAGIVTQPPLDPGNNSLLLLLLLIILHFCSILIKYDTTVTLNMDIFQWPLQKIHMNSHMWFHVKSCDNMWNYVILCEI